MRHLLDTICIADAKHWELLDFSALRQGPAKRGAARAEESSLPMRTPTEGSSRSLQVRLEILANKVFHVHLVRGFARHVPFVRNCQ